MGLFTTNAPAAKFKQVGDSVEGEIVDVYRGQRYEFIRNAIGEPMWWINGKPTPGVSVDPATGKKARPVLDYVITVDTGEPDENGESERRVFFKTPRMEKSLKASVAAARTREGLMLGGRLKVTYTGDDETSNAPTLPKMFDVVYTPPAPGQGREPSGEVRLAGGGQADDDNDEVARPLPTSPAPGPASDPAPTYRLKNHESSPVLNKREQTVAAVTGKAKYSDEPPF